MMDENPLRTFVVMTEDGPETIEAHVPVVADGCLQLMRYVHNMQWTIRIFAPGSWSSAAVSLPTSEDVTKMTAIVERENERAAAIENARSSAMMKSATPTTRLN